MVGSPLFQSLTEDLQEQAFLNPHLWTYLDSLDPETIGIPEFVPRLSKNLRGGSSNNFLYPVANRVFIHLYSSDGEARDHYIAIEPASSVIKSGLMDEVDKRLIDYVGDLQAIVGEEREKREAVLSDILDKVCVTNGNRGKRSALKVPPHELDELRYLMIREKEGMGAIQP